MKVGFDLKLMVSISESFWSLGPAISVALSGTLSARS
jgi:hypothetical protein